MEWISNVQIGEESNIQWSVKWSIDESAWIVFGRNAITGESCSEKVNIIPSHIFGPNAQDGDNINFALDRVIVKLGGKSKLPPLPTLV